MQPHVNPFFFEQESSMGDTVQVSCLVSKGDMPITFSWLFNGKPIPMEMSINIAPFGKKTSVLNIDYVDESHIGNFTCVAANKAGIATYSTELLVKGMTERYNCFMFSFIYISQTYTVLNYVHF